MLSAIVFDAVGTLISPEPSAPDVYVAVGRKHGSRHGAAEVADRFRAAFRAEETLDRERLGLRTSEARELERWRRIVARVLDDVADPAACFDELYRHFAMPRAWRCLPEVAETLSLLAERGLRLGLASNYDHRLRSVLAGLPELDVLNPVTISSEVGWRKPAAQFFKAVCQQIDVPPERILLVGDDLRNDYEGARAGGLRAVLLEPLRREPGVDRIERLGALPRWLAEHS